MSSSLITSRENQRVKQLRAALAETARPANGILGIEGEHLLEEALRSNLRIRTLFLREDRAAPPNLPDDVNILRLNDVVFRSIGPTPAPQGIAALIDTPHFSIDHALGRRRATATPPLLLVLDAIQDPGNLGTLLRSAEAFGATGCLLLPGTASLWNGKALRASAGSAFRLPTVPATLDTIGDLATRGIHLLAAVGDTTAQTSDTLDLTQPIAFLIGNEGAGLSPELLALAHARITLPCTGPVESLNAAVAGSLLLYTAQQQRSRAGAHSGNSGA